MYCTVAHVAYLSHPRGCTIKLQKLLEHYRNVQIVLLVYRGAIQVQPTATARRRQTLGRGSKRVAMGRPVNDRRVAEHGFAKDAHVKRKGRAAPHNLAYAVAQNSLLG